MIVAIAAWVTLGAIAIVTLGGPFKIGEDRGKYTAAGYVVNLVGFAVEVIVIGRALRWW